MSATINADLFAAYFAQPLGEHLEPAPIFKIEEKLQYEVKNYYIEDLAPLGEVRHFIDFSVTHIIHILQLCIQSVRIKWTKKYEHFQSNSTCGRI